ncbi:MAG TPA: TonB family protein [Pyrinomonadaceae bacterium]|nr:TonB family protein [Pyrinomonadaceae bacterium]
MRFLLSTIFLICFSLSAFSQTEQKKVIPLASLKIKERIVKFEFPNVPQEVRDFHARGQFRLRFVVDENGKVKEINSLSKFSEKVNEYLEETIKNWQFKPLKINGEKISYSGIVVIPFCYGSFSSWCL